MDRGEKNGSNEADTTVDGPPRSLALRVGTRLGRFELERVVGTGAMGVVYESRDPLLGRPVAIKTLRGQPSPEVRVRFAREAAALARLSHPNVVTIFEVHPGEDPFIVMELVDGVPLNDWLEKEKPSVPEVLRVMLQAGRGLAATHEAGLIHRDMKPANVLLESSGRVLLMDFGIARDVTGDWMPGPAAAGASTAPSGKEDTLTVAGSIVGTPAYMAPEQRNGKSADVAADQYAFCMVLHEAVFGKRRSTTNEPGEERALPRNPKVPGWLRRIILRGLAAAPKERWPDMPALLGAIEKGQRWQSRRRVLAVVVAVAGLSAVAALAAYRASPVSTCEARAQEVYRIWDGTTRERVRGNILERGGAEGQERWQRVEQEIDAYAKSWSDARSKSCLAGLEQQGVIVPGALDRVDECLQGRLDELRRLTDTLANATPEMLARTSTHKEAWLSQVAGCLEPLAPEEARATSTPERDLARSKLDRALDLERKGDLRGALGASDELVEAAEALGDGDWITSAYLTRGDLLADSGDPKAARDDLERAFISATADGDDEMAAHTAASLIEVLGVLGRVDDALLWEGRARALLSRFRGEGTLAEGAIEARLGNMYRLTGKPHAAIPHLERAIEIFGQRLGSVRNLHQKARLAAAKRDAGLTREAAESLRDVVAKLEAHEEGAHHLAEALMELSRCELALGETGRALEDADRGLELAQGSFGANSPLAARLREIQREIVGRSAETETASGTQGE